MVTGWLEYFRYTYTFLILTVNMSIFYMVFTVITLVTRNIAFDKTVFIWKFTYLFANIFSVSIVPKSHDYQCPKDVGIRVITTFCFELVY